MEGVAVTGARRFGGVPPVVVVLITIAAVVAATLVAWFMWTTTKSATSQPLFEITNAYSPDGVRLFFTLNNVGTQDASISQVIANCSAVGSGSGAASGSGSCALPAGSTSLAPGQSAACSVTLSGSTITGDLACAVTVVTNRGNAVLSLRAVRG